MTEFAFHNSQQLNRFLKTQESELPFLHKSVVSVTHEQNIICSKTLICRQLFAGHVVGSRPMKGKENTSNDNYIFSPLSLKNRDEKITSNLFFFFCKWLLTFISEFLAFCSKQHCILVGQPMKDAAIS